MPELKIYPDFETLTLAVAEHITSVAEAAIDDHGWFSIGLSGGSAPPPVHRKLTVEPLVSRIDWSRVYVFWGDERCVPPDHPDSNYGMGRDTLLKFVPIPENHIFRMRGELDPQQGAAEYEQLLKEFFAERGHQTARFDLLFQGMGEDGHTASLFPHTPPLHEQHRWVAANYAGHLDSWRITLTPPAINAAAFVVFMVEGEKKAPALQQVLNGPRNPDLYPSQLIDPEDGELWWMVDAAAAQQLQP